MNKQNENNESVRRQLLALGQMTQEEMIEKWKDLFGVQPPQYGRVFMRKRLAHRIQELFYGGLPEMLKTQMLEQKKLQKPPLTESVPYCILQNNNFTKNGIIWD